MRQGARRRELHDATGKCQTIRSLQDVVVDVDLKSVEQVRRLRGNGSGDDLLAQGGVRLGNEEPLAQSIGLLEWRNRLCVFLAQQVTNAELVLGIRLFRRHRDGGSESLAGADDVTG